MRIAEMSWFWRTINSSIRFLMQVGCICFVCLKMTDFRNDSIKFSTQVIFIESRHLSMYMSCISLSLLLLSAYCLINFFRPETGFKAN